MIQFTYKLKLNERVRAKCSRHPRYNPEKDAVAGIRGGCAACWDIYHVHRSRLELDHAVHEFLRHAAPWIKYRRPRESRPRKTLTVEDPPRPV
jgi:hypothetical protein